MSYDYQDAKMESQQEYFGTIHTDNTKTLQNALERIKELEKENETVTRKANEAIADKLLITAKYNEVLNDLNHQENDKLQKENKELKETVIKMNNIITETFSNLTKAKAIIKDYKFIASNITVCSVPEENRCINVLKLNEQAEQFLNRQGDNEDD